MTFGPDLLRKHHKPREVVDPMLTLISDLEHLRDEQARVANMVAGVPARNRASAKRDAFNTAANLAKAARDLL